MEAILYISHVESDGSLSKVALEALNGAVETSKALSASLTVGLFGANIASAANAIAGCGATKILGMASPELAQPVYATDASACEALMKASGATVVIAPNTSRLARVLPGVTMRVGGKIDTRTTAVEVEGGKLQIKRWYYRQRMIATVVRDARPWVITVESGSFVAYAGATGSATVENIALGSFAKRTTVLREEPALAGEQTIRPDAKLLFVAGAGWTKKQSDGAAHVKDAENTIRTFLSKSQASLGSSKSLVDQSGEGEIISFLTHLNQVGQTGASPRHPKGLATCCHGEEPHVVGWRFVNERRAINLDPNCGWAQGKADVLYVADAFAVMQKVNELL
jgi:electron transfer flavoprotein alpha subunit